MYHSLSQCELLVRRAAKHGGRRIQFVPTQYWYDKDNEQYAPNTCHPDNWSLQNKVDYYCQRHEWNSDCNRWDEGALSTFRNGFKSCLKVCVGLLSFTCRCIQINVQMMRAYHLKYTDLQCGTMVL